MRDTATVLRVTLALCAVGSLAACGEEPAPPSVQAFMDDPILLDATMVRCVANRDSVNYDPECVNAREAVERIGAAAEKERRAALEAESERKREALRQAQEATDEARRETEEAARLREEARLLGLLPADPAEVPADSEELSFIDVGEGGATVQVTVQDLPIPAPEGVDAASGEPSPGSAEPPPTTNLGEIREALEQRQSAAPPETSTSVVPES